MGRREDIARAMDVFLPDGALPPVGELLELLPRPWTIATAPDRPPGVPVGRGPYRVEWLDGGYACTSDDLATAILVVAYYARFRDDIESGRRAAL